VRAEKKMENRKQETGDGKPVIEEASSHHFSFPVFGFLFPVFHFLG
jgi:hypothetical protein